MLSLISIILDLFVGLVCEIISIYIFITSLKTKLLLLILLTFIGVLLVSVTNFWNIRKTIKELKLK